jgi:fatty-acyl-CoA synthase
MSTERPRSRHLAELVAEIATQAPDAPAVLWDAGAVSATQLDSEVDRFAAGLRTLGVRRGATVGLLCTNRLEWLGTALGAMRLGARVAAFNTFAKAWDLDYMLQHSDAQVLVTETHFRNADYMATVAELLPEVAQAHWSSGRYPALRAVVAIGDGERAPGVRSIEDVLGEGERALAADAEHVSAADDAFVLYTSGSTARPKAVPLQHYGVIENGFAIGERMGLEASDRVFISVPLFWAYGAVNALPASLSHGAAMVLQPAFEPAAALALIEQHRATAAYTLPNMTNSLLADPGFDRSRTASLRTGLSLGSPADMERAATELAIPGLCNIYGGTENYGNCCVTPNDWPLERRIDCQGPPLPGVTLRIVGEDGGVLGVDEVGEIQVRGYVMRGYLGAPEATAAVFDADGWYRSGDLGRLDEDGGMHFVVRSTEMIKTNGINVAPSEVEEFLAGHEAVAEVAVIGIDDAGAGQAVVAFVVAAPGHDPEPSALREWCTQRIARFKVPARIHVVDALPKTDTDKLSRRDLPAMDVERVGR